MADAQHGALLARLRQAREPRLTQAALAAEMGVTPNTVSNWETGKTEPSWSQLIHLAQILPSPELLLAADAATDAALEAATKRDRARARA